MQKLTIKFECETETIEASIERDDITNDEMFWEWLVNVWGCLGLNFITEELKK